jgi:hypothetical protein
VDILVSIGINGGSETTYCFFFVADSMSKIGDWSQRAPYSAAMLEAEHQADVIDFRNAYGFDDV